MMLGFVIGNLVYCVLALARAMKPNSNMKHEIICLIVFLLVSTCAGSVIESKLDVIKVIKAQKEAVIQQVKGEVFE